MVAFVPAYDCERPGACLPAAKALVALHEWLGIPATFFIVGELLRDEPEWRHLLAAPLFEVASHTWSHRLLRPAPNGDPAVDDAARHEEIVLGKHAVEDTFGRPCLGLRPANGHPDGLRGDPWLVADVGIAGYRYVSSQLWGPRYTWAPLRAPWPYFVPGDAQMWELPAHGPHDTAATHWQTIGSWSLAAEDVPSVPYLSFVRHPWRIAEHQDFGRIEAVLGNLSARGFTCTTYADQWRTLDQDGTEENG